MRKCEAILCCSFLREAPVCCRVRVPCKKRLQSNRKRWCGSRTEARCAKELVSGAHGAPKLTATRQNSAWRAFGCSFHGFLSSNPRHAVWKSLRFRVNTKEIRRSSTAPVGNLMLRFLSMARPRVQRRGGEGVHEMLREWTFRTSPHLIHHFISLLEA